MTLTIKYDVTSANTKISITRFGMIKSAFLDRFAPETLTVIMYFITEKGLPY